MKQTILFTLILIFSFQTSRGQSMVSLEDKDFHPDIPIDTSVLNWLNSFNEYKKLREDEQNIYYWVNFMRKDPKRFNSAVIAPFIKAFKGMDNADSRSLKEELQTSQGLKLLQPNSILIRTAATQASDLGQNGRKISHNSTQGKTFGDRMKEAGIQKCAFENIYRGKKDPLEAIILLLIDSGVPNKGHRKALLNSDITSMGVSFAAFEAEKNFVMVQDFSCD